MADTPTRKLAVILHADVIGSTALVQSNETLAHERIQDAFHRFSEIISNYGGVAHEIRGDALVAEFSRVSDAISASLAFQISNAARNEELSDDICPVVRVGIAMGEVIVADNTVTGTGVVLAQRLEQLAEKETMCIQGAAYETVPKRFPFSYRSLGEHHAKGFVEPIRVYAVSLKAGAVVPDPEASIQPDATEPESFNKPTIAVLPFTNMSGDPEQEYFSDGITEDIINALSHFRSFPVIARNSTFTYKGQAIRVQQVAAELGARYVLEGSVRKARNRIRIATQLVDAETGHHVWAGKFDSTMDDIFDVQDEISQKIVATIQPELAQAELEKTAVKRPESLTAWDLVLRGMALVNRHTPDDHKPARELFRSAIELAPNYADAWAGIAWSYLANVILVGTDERQVLMKKGLRAAMEAVKLDDRSAFAHYVLGVAYAWDEQFQKAISEAEISLQLNPYSAQAHMGLGNRLDLVGRTEEGIIKMEQGLQLSPRDPFCPTIMSYLCRAYLSLEKPERALEWIEKAVNLKPQNSDLQYRYAICLTHLDRIEDAKRALSECERQQPGFLAKRKHWRPYSDDERNQSFFGGFLRHNLLSDNRSTTGLHE
jgi:adenylate cyclase